MRWQRPREPLILCQDEVHVWRIGLDLPQDDVARLASLLSSEETARAARMACPEIVRRWVVSHGAVRQILSRYLDQPAESLGWTAGPRGKPHLLPRAGVPT